MNKECQKKNNNRHVINELGEGVLQQGPGVSPCNNQDTSKIKKKVEELKEFVKDSMWDLEYNLEHELMITIIDEIFYEELKDE